MLSVSVIRFLITAGTFICLLGCSGNPVESETLSSLLYGQKRSFRTTVFGVLTPEDEIHKILVEDSRNNVLDAYKTHAQMTVSGSLNDLYTTYTLEQKIEGIKDPFQLTDFYSYSGADSLITWVAFEAGLTRSVRWLTTETMEVGTGNTYRLDLQLTDSKYADIEIIIRDSTTVPGNFTISYPEEGSVISPDFTLRIRWTKSKDAESYRVIASTPLNNFKKFNAIVRDTVCSVPLFFDEPAQYSVQVWALDANYGHFLRQRLEGQRVNRTHFFDYGEMNLSALVVFGSRVMRSVEFTVE